MEEKLQPKAPQKRSSPRGRRSNGREQGRLIRRYLGALEASRSNRGTKRVTEGISRRLRKSDELLVSADPLARLHLTQERIDLHAELVRATNGQAPQLADLEKEFVRVAKSYGDLAGITFAAWRQVGVDADVLERAGIVRAAPARERERTNGPGLKATPANGEAAAAADEESKDAPAPPAPAAQAPLPDVAEVTEPPGATAEKPAPALRRRRIPDEGST